MENNINFGDTAIRKLFFRFLIPTVLGMLFSAIFIITDGIFVGKGLGSDALAAVNLVAPIYMLATGVGLMFGMGGSIIAAIRLSRRQNRLANITITQAILIPAIGMTIVTLIILIFRQGIIQLLGTPAELYDLADEYLFYFALFLMPGTLVSVFMFIIRLDNAPKFAMLCNIIAAVLNILFDYLFIFVFKWGMMGAAVATGIGIMVEILLMLIYMFRYSKTLHFSPLKGDARNLRFTTRSVNRIMQAGSPALLSELAISCLMIVGNYIFIRYTGKDGVAAFSIACYTFPIIFMIYSGIIQAAQPIISYNHGARNRRRVQDTLLLALKTSGICGLLFFLANCFFNHQVISLFLRADSPAYAIASGGLPYFAAGYLFFGLNITAIGYYQSIEKGRLAARLTILRGIILLTACFLLLPPLLGVRGIWLALPAAELITLFIILLLYRRQTTVPLKN